MRDADDWADEPPRHITAVCPCGDEWSFDVQPWITGDRIHAAAAVAMAIDSLKQIRAYNLHLTDRAKHPKGR